MNKGEIVVAVADSLDVSRKVVTEVLDEILTMMLKTLGSKESVKFSGLGTFYVVDRGPRTGRNPKTGEAVDVPAKTVVKFKASRALRELF
jgi:DNA-binding protein HU-beta